MLAQPVANIDCELGKGDCKVFHQHLLYQDWHEPCTLAECRTIFDRSSELLEKLASAGIGNRPIIWVTHSMGGLLVKQLLCQGSQIAV
ncbi:unnamed protein product [Allacma fusca]|uniref:Uncharacterized protein n=1 Tax=Allacma fusca TaxID=39272 RepID=A0A8J2PRF5_9HEXA|nr:unnamed protein product [Allacma fusca]